jgi:hypothetical protein
VSSFEVRYLTLCVFTSNSITFLHLPDELIALSLDDLPIIVGQSAPFSLAFPTSYFQFPLIWSVFICLPHSSLSILPTTSVAQGSPAYSPDEISSSAGLLK